tara:strand:+ start:1910 stop:3010 length:1101 start_codon:yes stop_codon:yes gene_type:complete
VKKLIFNCLVAEQSKDSNVVSFVANANQIQKIARISRVGRDSSQELFGFQRSQIGNHIQEIHDYLEKDDSVLPNAIILAFTKGVELKLNEDKKSAEILIDLEDQPIGLIVDGQQRFSALRMLENKNFEVFVSAIICKDEDELQKQFILINNTKPLPKELIYELLPTVDGLPPRLSARSFASSLTQELNFMKDGVFQNLIKIHTNPNGVFTATALHKIIMNSKRDGALRELFRDGGFDLCLNFVNEFYTAVKVVFEESWYVKDDKGKILGEHTPRTSRLIHSAGITSLGHIMDAAFSYKNCTTKGQFVDVLNLLKPYCAWTSGEWLFSPSPKHWSEVQNTSKDISQLREFLYGNLMLEIRKKDRKVG